MKQTFDDLVDTLAKGSFYLGEAVELLEKTFIARTLANTDGNCSAASKLLGIHRNTLQKKIHAYKLDTPRPARKPPQKVKRISGRVKSAS
jgi:DNA-binding NtrC family response regulator